MFFKKKKSREQVSVVNATSKDIIQSMDNMISCYWWDTSLNFGDWIGPWIISLKSGKNVVNTKNIESNSSTIFSVGSILHHLPQSSGKVAVWGSGLIKPITWRKSWNLKRKMKDVDFIAVRGRLTHQEITSKLKVDVPEIFGDPALLLSKYYTPKIKKNKKIVLCPHYSHYEDLKQNFLQYDNVNVINLKRDPRDVIEDIVNAEICVSSSLHGLIIAQTYGIPWIWVRFEDNKLAGDCFKFYDFFSTLKDCPQDHVVVHSIHDFSYDNLVLASKKAQIFELSIDLQLLDSALDSLI